MNLGKYIFGIREEYLKNSSEAQSKRQIYIYNLLTVMLLFLTLLIFLAGLVYGLVIFQHWVTALALGFVLAAVTFNLLLLSLFLNLRSGYSGLNDQEIDMESVFHEYRQKDLSSESDEKLQKIVEEFSFNLSKENEIPDGGKFHWSNIVKSSIKVGLIMIIAIIVSRGLQLFLFRNQLNYTIEQVVNSSVIKEQSEKKSQALGANEQSERARWVLEMCAPDPESHSFISCKSIILAFELLESSSDRFLIFIDVLFVVLFLIPFVMIQKGKEFRDGDYLREVVLNNIKVSLMHFLVTQRKTQQMRKLQQ